VKYTVVDKIDQLADVVQAVSESDLVGFDTEFVAEDCYQSDLCLLQVSTRESVFIVDPRSIDRLDDLWDLLISPSRTVIMHAAREEILFVYRNTGKPIPKLFDVQIALGLLGGEYPASYGKLLQRTLGEVVPKGETRTDWRKRPLSGAQLNYAALDVFHLPDLYDHLTERLEEVGRLGWLEDELQRRQTRLLEVHEQEGWYRMSGIQSLRGKQLGIVRELWLWRDRRARYKDMPARRVLRDDLVVELARRGTADPKKISQIRGLHHSGFQRFIPDIAKCVSSGTSNPVPSTPWSGQSKRTRPPALLQQFLNAAMSFLCRSNHIAPSIVGSSDDVGRLAAYWMDGIELEPDDPNFPHLLQDWRADLVGEPLHEIFLGKRALRVQNPRDEMPLSLCDIESVT